MSRRFQFSLGRLMVATALAALAFGCWALAKTSDVPIGAAAIPLMGAAVGHIFGRGLWGAAIGVILMLAWIALILLMLQ